MAALSVAQTHSCRTALDVPCYTLRGTATIWQLSKTGKLEITELKSTYVNALRRDGSHVSLDESESSRFFSSAGWKGKITRMYLAPEKEIVTVDHAQGTIARREPLSWSDLPYRRSTAGDTTCESGIQHSGTDFRMESTSTLAGIAVVRWSRAIVNGREEQDLAPSLDCIALRRYRIQRNSFLLPIEIFSTEATSVEFGEPSSDLFKIPSSYRAIVDPQRATLIRLLEENGNRGAAPRSR